VPAWYDTAIETDFANNRIVYKVPSPLKLRGVFDCKNIPLVYTGYHAKFGRRGSNNVGLRRSNLGLGSVTAPLEAWSSPTRVSLQNLTIVGKRYIKHGKYPLLKWTCVPTLNATKKLQMTRIDQPTYDFLLVIHSRPNYGPIYIVRCLRRRFRLKETGKFYYPAPFNVHS